MRTPSYWGAVCCAAAFFGALHVSSAQTTTAPKLPDPAAMIARAKALELNTPYVPPPGDPLEHNTSGYAKTMCSAVFITGLDPDVAAESVGYFTGPYEEREEGRQAGHRSREEGSADHDAERRDRGRAAFRLARLHRAAAREGRRVLHARGGQEHASRSDDARPGRWATCCRRRRCRPASTRPR